MAAPILNLNTLVDRPTVVLDGIEYWLLTYEVLPPLDSYQLQAMNRRVAELMKREDALSEAEILELQALPNRIAHIVLEAPDEVHAKLNDRQRMQIAYAAMTTFLLDLKKSSPASGPALPAAPSTGVTSSPGSPGSTGATP